MREQLRVFTHCQSLEEQAHLQVARDAEEQNQPNREKAQENHDDRHPDAEEEGSAS